MSNIVLIHLPAAEAAKFSMSIHEGFGLISERVRLFFPPGKSGFVFAGVHVVFGQVRYHGMVCITN